MSYNGSSVQCFAAPLSYLRSGTVQAAVIVCILLLLVALVLVYLFVQKLRKIHAEKHKIHEEFIPDFGEQHIMNEIVKA